MMMKKILLIISLCILFGAMMTPAYSSDQENKHDYNGHFGDLDANGDDQISLEEFNKYFSHAEENVFKKADANRDGQIDHDEWHEYKAKNGYKHKE